MPPPEDTLGRWSAAVDFTIPNPTIDDGHGHTLVDNRGLFVLHAVLLKNGNVLCFCGHVEAAFYAPTSYVFNPLNPTASMSPINFPPGMDLFCCHYVQVPDGKILVVGGSDTDFQHHGSVGARNVAIFDPDTNTWAQARVAGRPVELIQGRWYPTPVLLPDGRVFVASGRPEHNGGVIADKVEILTGPDWDRVELTGASKQLPIYPGLHLAPNGKIYFTHTNWGQEIVDPPTMSIEVTAGSTAASWTEFPATINNPAQRRREEGMSVLLPPAQDGKILVIGGTQAENAAGTPILNGGTPPGEAPPDAFRKIHAATDPFTAEILDTAVNPPTWDWAPGSPMHFGRTNGHCVLLPDMTVLICGGHNGYKWQATSGSPTGTQPSLTAEIFKPGAGGGFTNVAAMHRPRMYHSVALLLPDGRVMCAGGADPNRGEPVLPWPADWGGVIGPDDQERAYDPRSNDPGSPLGYEGMPLNDKSFEFYEPPYFFNGTRPVITEIKRNGTKTRRIEYGQQFQVETSQAASIDRVGLMRPNAPTHHTDTEQRYVRLEFTKQTNQLTVTAVSDPKIAPPGFYMLWIVATGLPNGLPCQKAEFIHLVPVAPAPPPPAPPAPTPPAPEPKGKCFVATATLGSEAHPSVIYLRELRRRIADDTALGRRFIRAVNRVYQSFSPQLAAVLERRPLPRRAVRDCVVRPAVTVIAATERATGVLPPPLRDAALVSLLALEGILGAAVSPLLAGLVALHVVVRKLFGERHA